MGEHLPRGGWSVARRRWRGARAYQEDDLRVVEPAFDEESEQPGVLLVLADGMGGEVGGAQASHSVVETFANRFGQFEGTTDERLNACLDVASGALAAQVREDPDLDGMGSTVVAALYDGAGVTWLSVGDSPMWLFAEGRMTRLNEDHSMAPVLDRMVEDGELSAEEALRDRRRHMLRSAVTGYPVELVDCDHHAFRLGRNDFLVLASDGLETLPDGHIERILGATRGDAEAAAEALMSAVKDAGQPHQDNVTLLVLSGAEGGGEERARPGFVLRDRSAGNLVRRLRADRLAMAGSLLVGVVAAVGLIWWMSPAPPDRGAPVPPAPGEASGESPPGARPAQPEASGGNVSHGTGSGEAPAPAPTGPAPPAPPAADPRPEAVPPATRQPSSAEGVPSPETPAPAEGAPPAGEASPAEEAPSPETPAPAEGAPSTGETSPAEDSPSPETPAPAEAVPPAGEALPAEEAPSPETPAPAEDAPPAGESSPVEEAPSPETPAPAEAAPPVGEASPAEEAPSPETPTPAEGAPPAGEASPAEDAPSTEECLPSGGQSPAEECLATGEPIPADESPPPEDATDPGGTEPETTEDPSGDEAPAG